MEGKWRRRCPCMMGVVVDQYRVCRLGEGVVVGGTGIGAGDPQGEDTVGGVRHSLGMNAGSAHSELLLRCVVGDEVGVVCVVVLAGVQGRGGGVAGVASATVLLNLWRLIRLSCTISCSWRRRGEIISGGCSCWGGEGCR